MTRADPESTQKVVSRGVPLGPIGTGEEIATAVAFLLSDDASYITGHISPSTEGSLPELNRPGTHVYDGR
jgi:NAD(P)-dependent dehydrogenase (short-subunit alcohol dehydrogenase family)